MEEIKKSDIRFGVLMAICILTWSFATAGGRQFMGALNGTIAVDSTSTDSLNLDQTANFLKTSSGSVTFVSDNVDPRTGVDIRSMNGAIIISPSSTTTAGFGTTDTAIIRLLTSGLGFAEIALDSVRAPLPCTLWVNLANINDTLIKRAVIFNWAVYDTAKGPLLDGSSSIQPYKINWEIIGRD